MAALYALPPLLLHIVSISPLLRIRLLLFYMMDKDERWCAISFLTLSSSSTLVRYLASMYLHNITFIRYYPKHVPDFSIE